MKASKRLLIVYLPGCLLLAAVIFFAAYDRDKAEFELFRGCITDRDVNAYVQHRNEFFGSREAYDEFSAASDAELKRVKNLRKCLDLQGRAQTVFYRWVRKAYMNAGVTNVPRIIYQRSTEKLREQLEKVQLGYGDDFQQGG